MRAPGVSANADWTPVIRGFEGVEMALVPAGCFRMGSDDGDSDESPVHEQCFTEPFWIDRYEVTNAQFDALGGAADEANRWSDPNRPRERIRWDEASAFCAIRGARLPTEAEWEYAARGPDALTYPWGDDFIAVNVVYEGNSGSQTADVVGADGNSARPGGASWVGAQDMAGNVWEWTSSLYRRYPYVQTDGREDAPSRDGRVLRGGSWNFAESIVRAATRSWSLPDGWFYNLGFRCALSR